MAKDTKQRILDEALVMFAHRVYEGTNMRELAQALGLGKSALYKHYASKEDIWSSMLDALEAHYSEGFGSDDNLPPIPDKASIARRLIDDWLNSQACLSFPISGKSQFDRS